MSSETMKAFKLVQWGQPGQFVDVPKPVPQAGQVLIRMAAAGLCRSDLDMVDSQPGSEPYTTVMDAGYILGHENAGYIAELGEGVSDLHVGEAVILYALRHCSSCEHCTSGAEQHCQAFRRGAIVATRGVGLDGGLAEYLVAPRSEVISLGSEDPVSYAPLSDAGATAYHAVQKILQRLKPTQPVAVVGVGGLGSFAVQYINVLSSAQVVAIDKSQDRLKIARDLGAEHVALFNKDVHVTAEEVKSLTNGYGVAAVVDFVGSNETLQLAAKIVRPQGQIVHVGMDGGTLTVGWNLLPTACEYAISLGNTRQDLREVCDLHRSGKLKVSVERFGFDQVQLAYDRLRNGQLSGRAVVVFS